MGLQLSVFTIFLTHILNVNQQLHTVKWLSMKSWTEFRRIIQATCCVPALEKQKAAIALKTGKRFSQRTTHTHIHTQVPKPTAPYITMIKHSDQTRTNPSFINVTADVVAKKGLPVPLLPGQWMQHLATLLLVTATLSINHWVERESTASQSRQGHANTSGTDQDINATMVTGLRAACADQCTAQHQQAAN